MIASPLLPVSGIWLLPFTAYNIFHSIRVCWERKQNKMKLPLPPTPKSLSPHSHESSLLGDTLPATDRSSTEPLKADPLFAAVRTQVNFLEITPWALGLGALAELNGARRSTLNDAFAILFLLRLWHGEGGIMLKNRKGLGRLIGYWGSMIWVGAMAVFNARLCWEVWSWS